MKSRTGRSELRRRAEKRVREASGRPAGGRPDGHDERLLHELQVHQVELEMQNDELRTSRLEAEKLLARYTELFEYAPIGYFVLSHEGTVLQCNFAAARLLGHERGSLAGRPLASHVSLRDQRAFEKFLVSVLTQPSDDTRSATQDVLFRTGGGELWGRLTGTALDRGSAPTALVALEDMTARRRAEEALREEARRKDEFLAALSHELRNPLAPIGNALALLHAVAPGSEKAGAALAIVDRQLKHLTRIVDDLLDVARVARGKIQLHPEPLELGELVRSTVEDHAAAFEERGVGLGASVPPEPCWVDGDASRLVQVLGNLLANALKFTDPGGRVHVSLEHGRRDALLVIRDDGIGMDEALMRHLFQPFSQGSQSLDRSRGGLGLGLATVKGIVELHGGTISVASEPGRGSVFTVRLPLAPEPRAPVRAQRSPRPSERRRVLIVEDNDDAAHSLEDLLALAGHDVRVASDGHAGLSLARAFQPEVILCDLGLPGMSGFEFAKALRADRLTGRPWLVALSGYAQLEDVRRSSESGFDRHVTKPASLETIEEVIAQAGV